MTNRPPTIATLRKTFNAAKRVHRVLAGHRPHHEKARVFWEQERFRLHNLLFDYADIVSLAITGIGINALLEKQGHGYRPTIRTADGSRYTAFADLYDFIAEQRGLSLRAYRGIAR